jgi:hypothetical protein
MSKLEDILQTVCKQLTIILKYFSSLFQDNKFSFNLFKMFQWNYNIKYLSNTEFFKLKEI